MRLTPEMPIWPGHPLPVVERMASMSEGSPANITRVAFCAHIGTHVDAPLHFVADGTAIEQVPLDQLVGRAFVADLTGVDAIGVAEVIALPKLGDASIVLFKTRNSSVAMRRPDFAERYVAIDPWGARALIDRGVRTVGIDYLSVEDFDSTSFETHKTLLGASVTIVEGLDLDEVTPGFYEFVCLPICIVGADGAPARAILIER